LVPLKEKEQALGIMNLSFRFMMAGISFKMAFHAERSAVFSVFHGKTVSSL